LEAKPGGIGGGHSVKETHEVCRDNKGTNVKESGPKGR
jgi:hypothetical protein